MNKLYTVFAVIVLLLCIVTRFIEFLLETMLETKCISVPYMLEVFCNRRKDRKLYTPIREHWKVIKECWSDQHSNN